MLGDFEGIGSSPIIIDSSLGGLGALTGSGNTAALGGLDMSMGIPGS